MSNRPKTNCHKDKTVKVNPECLTDLGDLCFAELLPLMRLLRGKHFGTS